MRLKLSPITDPEEEALERGRLCNSYAMAKEGLWNITS